MTTTLYIEKHLNNYQAIKASIAD